MKRSSLITTAVAAAVVLAFGVWAFAPRPLVVETAAVTQGPFEMAVEDDARTRLAERYVVSAPLAARLARITLREGDAVQAGDVLARLEPVLSPLLDERTRREQQARVEGAQAGVALSARRVDAARVALERTRDELRRSEQLAQQGFIAPTKLSTDRLQVQAAQKELEAAVEAGHIARHDLQQAQVALGITRGAGGAGSGGTAPVFELRAPVAGRVLKRHVTSEGTVALGTPLLELGDTARLEVVAELLTTDALQVRPGSPVRIERWGGPVALQGQVQRVEPAAFTKVSALGVEEQRVNVVITLTSPREQWAALGDGYRVGVRIVTLQQPRVLKVPVGAVFPVATASGSVSAPAVTGATAVVATAPASVPATSAAVAAAAASAPGADTTATGMGALPTPQAAAVFVLDGGRARQRAVRLVARNGSEAWLADGVAVGEQVLVYPAPGVTDGVRVRPR